MIIEERKIAHTTTGGFMPLKNLAIPETVRVTLLGTPIIPQSFDCYGQPFFTDEQTSIIDFKDQEYQRKTGLPLEVQVTYEKRIFDIKKSSFDSIKGIKKSLRNLSDLNEMLDNRRMFHKAYPYENLDEFMIFGMFYLDSLAQVWSIAKPEKGKMVSYEDVEPFRTFLKNNVNGVSTTSDGGYTIPKANSICPCCGKKITIEDIKNNSCIIKNEKVYHEICWCNYRKLQEIDKLTRCLMDSVYKSEDYTFELLPNGYSNSPYLSHIPWILFHTIDGDIIVGWRKRVISIEWQENYKPFNLKELFSKEDVTKLENGKKRCIHAWGEEKADEYLTKALKAVNPKYSRY